MAIAPVKRVIIVGGGTAGWLSAAMLSRAMGHALEIIVIESEEIGTVGVGEATIPSFLNAIRFLALDENEVFAQTQGTFKLGIEFNNWHRKGASYGHMFGQAGQPLGLLPFYQYWLRRHLAGGEAAKAAGSLWDYSLNARAAAQNRFMRLDRIPDSPLEGIVYAMQFDALLFARYLRGRCERAGVIRREGRVSGVNLRGEDGFIESLTMQDGEVIAGDMFIDCSGFQGLLIEGALKVGYHDWRALLPCDRAVAVPTRSSGPLLPYTRATAHSAGWQWRIPLQHRTGNGHVFCSSFMSDDEATRIVLENLDGERLAEPRVLKFTTGKRKSVWVKNCLALGLASGFMEPLESTSIHLVQSGMTRFLTFFPDMEFNPIEIAEYNRLTAREYELIRDFLVLHYKATERDDSDFWNYCRTMAVPDSLTHKIEFFRQHGRVITETDDLFREFSWVQVLLGQGIVPKGAPGLTWAVKEPQLAEFMANIRLIQDRTMRDMPNHEAYIAQACKAPAV